MSIIHEALKRTQSKLQGTQPAEAPAPNLPPTAVAGGLKRPYPGARNGTLLLTLVALVTVAVPHSTPHGGIANDVGEELPRTPFIPRSLTGRAAALGGRTRVEWPPDGSTVVVVEIPL